MIDPHAVIDESARLAEGVSVGPYAVIGPDVEIGAGTWIGPHAVINGPTSIGRENKIYQFTSIGEQPQDKRYAGEPTRLEIGDRNTIREYTNINRGTASGGGVTRIGNDNWIMATCHIAHDCRLGDNIIFANGASMAGHAIVEDHAILSGFVLVHQFVSIGAHAYCAMGSGIAKDVPPFVTVYGNPARPRSINTEGLKRRGFDPAVIRQLRKVYKLLYKSKLKYDDAFKELQKMADDPDEIAREEIGRMVVFLQNCRRAVVR